MYKKPKSRISIRNLLRNRITAAVAITGCITAVGIAGFHQFHKPDSEVEAHNAQVRGVINSLDDFDGVLKDKPLNKKGRGSESSPFVILDIVPAQENSEWSYFVSGCENTDAYVGSGAFTMEAYNKYKAAGKLDEFDAIDGNTGSGGVDNLNLGTSTRTCFEDEDYPGKGSKQGDELFKYKWIKRSGSITLPGYYEKVNSGDYSEYQHFSIVGLDEDNRPVFEKNAKGEWIWVTLGDEDSEPVSYSMLKQLENKEIDPTLDISEIENDIYKEGDREYTSRTDDNYREMGSAYFDYGTDDDPETNGIASGETQRVLKFMYRHYDLFLRYSLRLRKKSDVDNYNIVVKTVVPEELNEHPEWIDKADFIALHQADGSGAMSSFYKRDFGNEMLSNIKAPEVSDATAAANVNKNAGSFATHDITFEVAEKLFFKVNGLDYYDGYYAPLILETGTYDKMLGYTGTGEQTDDTYALNYGDMSLSSENMGKGGSNNNWYKFILMDWLMDVRNFYQLFYNKDDNNPVIQTKDGVGQCVPQNGTAKSYWMPETFLPYYDGKGSATWVTDEYKEILNKYGVYFDDYGTYLRHGNKDIKGHTFTYNAGNGVAQLSLLDDFNSESKNTEGLFEWIQEKDGKEYSQVTNYDIFFFLLNYDKDDTGTSGKKKRATLRVLDIEPCSDYSECNTTMLKALFPTSKYKVSSISITHQTSAEFNGNNRSTASDLMSDYDVIYIGATKSKLGKSGNATYNDSSLDGLAYTHVGDSFTTEGMTNRASGNDITGVALKEIAAFARAGKTVVINDDVYSADTKVVAKNSNMHKLCKGDDKITKEVNVTSYTDQLKSEGVDVKRGAAEINMISTPKKYINYKESENDDNPSNSNDSLGSGKNQRLTFKFTIGFDESAESYAAQFMIDSNGDGQITNRENAAEKADTWSDSGAGTSFTAATIRDSKGDAVLDENGEEQAKEYSVSYKIPSTRENGAIAWKFILYNTADGAIRYDWSGVSRYTGYEPDGSETATIKGKNYVLDETSDHFYNKENGKKLIRLLQVVGDGDSTSANLEKCLDSSGNLFGKYAGNLDDYEFAIDTITISQYLDAFEDAKSDPNASSFTKNGTYNYPQDYENYDMFVYSCGKDLQEASNENGAVSYAAYIASSGRSVVYTKDSISYAPAKNMAMPEETDWPAINMPMLKDTAGLSRYTSSDKTTKGYNDYYDGYNLSSYNSMEMTYHKATGGTGKVYNSSGASEIKKATKTNDGTINNYPYTIDNDIGFSDAKKASDFQINLELNDQEMAVNTWYSLGARNDDGENNGYYTISPNDAMNNYYLFNLVNIFYSGIDIDAAQDEDQEMELFVNTLIASYEAAYGEPYLYVDSLRNVKKKKTESWFDEVGPEIAKKNATKSPGDADEEGLDFYTKNAKTDDDNYMGKKPGSVSWSDTTVNGLLTGSTLMNSFSQDVENAYVGMITLPGGGSINYKEIYESQKDKTDDENETTTVYKKVIEDATATEEPEEDEEDGNGGEESQATDPNEGIKVDTLFTGGSIDWSGQTKINSSTLSSYDDEDTIEFTYQCKDSSVSEPMYIFAWPAYRDYIKYGRTDAEVASYVFEGGSADEKTVRITIGELKDYICAFNKGMFSWENYTRDNVFSMIAEISISTGTDMNDCELLSVKIYGKGYKFAESEEDSGSDASASNVEKTKNVTYKEVFRDDANPKTHMIWFTPYEGSIIGPKIRNLKIYYVDSTGKKIDGSDVTEIFEGTEASEKTYNKYTTTDENYNFSNAFISGNQYFITYNQDDVSDSRKKYVCFEISSMKQTSKTLMELTSSKAQNSKQDVLLFNLD